MKKILSHYESFALTEYLSFFPEDKTYTEVIQMVLDRDPEVMPWEIVENIDPERLTDIIDSLRVGLKDAFVPREEDI